MDSNLMVFTDTDRDIFLADTSRIPVVEFRRFVATLLSVSSSITESKFTKHLLIYGDLVNE